MKQNELRKICVNLYGESGWQSALARDLEIDSRSVRRWVAGDIPVPGPVAAFLKVKVENKRLMASVDRMEPLNFIAKD